MLQNILEYAIKSCLGCYTELWRMWRPFLIHLTHTYIGSISVEAVEGFLKRHHIWTCHTDLWRMWRAFLSHITNTDVGSSSEEAVKGFLIGIIYGPALRIC